jgi:hypothetical protein
MKSYRTLLYVSLSTLLPLLLQGCPYPETETQPSEPATLDDKSCYIPPYNRVNGLVGEGYTWTRITEGPQAGTIFCKYTEGGALRG